MAWKLITYETSPRQPLVQRKDALENDGLSGKECLAIQEQSELFGSVPMLLRCDLEQKVFLHHS